MPGPVALTGATGFIGRHIAEQLLASGHSVRALTRRPQPDRPGLTWIAGHLADAPALRNLTAGASAVIHCAGAVRGADSACFSRINVDGTRAVAAAALASATAPKFVLISSLAAREPALSWYAASKRAAESVLEEERVLRWTILRPPAVYGPGDREILPLFRSMRRGWLPVAAPPGARFSLLHVGDLAGLIRISLEAEAIHRTYEPDDGTARGYDWTSVRETAERAWGRRIRSVPVPLALLRGAAYLNLAVSRVVRHAPMLTPGKVRELSHVDWVCDNAPVMRELDWRPTIRLADALAQPTLVGL